MDWIAIIISLVIFFMLGILATSLFGDEDDV